MVGDTVDGVPDTTPVLEFNINPPGNAGTIENVLLAPNSAEVTVCVGVMATPTRPASDCDDGVNCPGAAIVMRTVETPKFTPSATVMMWSRAVWRAVGVPVITPVVLLSESPAGSAGVIENTFVPVTAGAVIAVVADIGTPIKPLSV